MLNIILYFILLISCTNLYAGGDDQYKQAKTEQSSYEKAIPSQSKTDSDDKMHALRKATPEDTARKQAELQKQATTGIPTISKKPISLEIVKKPYLGLKTTKKNSFEATKYKVDTLKLSNDSAKQVLKNAIAPAKEALYDPAKEKFTKIKNKINDIKTKHKTSLKVIGALWGTLMFGASIIGLGLKINSIISETTKSDITGIDSGILTPSVYPEAQSDDDNYENNLTLIANNFNDIQSKFKDALENNDYNNAIFKIEAGNTNLNSSTVNVEINYDLQVAGAGNIGMPFTPFFLSIQPEEIDGYALNADSLILKIPSDDNKSFAEKIIYPNASLIFLIKYILFHLTTFKNTTDTDTTTQTTKALSQVIMLLYRYTLTPSQEELSTDNILHDIPKSIIDYTDQTLVTLPNDLIQILDLQKDLSQDTDIKTNDFSLKTILESYVKYFLSIYNKKFACDSEYKKDDNKLDKYETLGQILAIYIRCMKMVTQAEEYLLNTKVKSVTLKTLKGKMIINPSISFDKTVKPHVKNLLQAQTNLDDATVKFKEKTIDLTEYNAAKSGVSVAAEKVATAYLTFRKNYTLYYPIKQSKGLSKTIVEFAKDELNTLKKRGDSQILNNINEFYNAFEQVLGLPLATIWKKTQILKNEEYN